MLQTLKMDADPKNGCDKPLKWMQQVHTLPAATMAAIASALEPLQMDAAKDARSSLHPLQLYPDSQN